MKFKVLVPIAAVTNYLKPSDLNNASLLPYNSAVQMLKMGPTGWNQDVGKATFLSECLGPF